LKLYQDEQVITNIDDFIEDQIDLCKDEDCDTDSEILNSSVQMCFQDLLILKKKLARRKVPLLQVNKIWAHKFKTLPRS
jgi:hypothetical protein